MLRGFLFLALFGFVVEGRAQDWSAEPSSFRSVKLGAPFSGQFPECKKDKRGAYEYAPHNTCYQSDGRPNPYAHGAVLANVFNLPDIGVDGTTAVKGLSSTQISILDGNVVRVRIVYTSGFFDSFNALLVDKFGAAHSKVFEKLQNKMGASFEGQVSQWQGQTVNIFSQQYYGSLKYSIVDVTLNSFSALEAASTDGNRERNKSNL